MLSASSTPQWKCISQVGLGWRMCAYDLFCGAAVRYKYSSVIIYRRSNSICHCQCVPLDVIIYFINHLSRKKTVVVPFLTRLLHSEFVSVTSLFCIFLSQDLTAIENFSTKQNCCIWDGRADPVKKRICKMWFFILARHINSRISWFSWLDECMKGSERMCTLMLSSCPLESTQCRGSYEIGINLPNCLTVSLCWIV